MHKLRDNAEKELRAIEEKGLTASNLDNAYKLTEIIKGIDKIEMMKGEGEYSNDRGGYSRDGDGGGYARDGYANDREDYDRGNSYRRGRSPSTGRFVHRPNNYSRLAGEDQGMEEYRERKREYSNSRDGGSKDRMLDALENFMSATCNMVKQICRDADCTEERDIVMHYIHEMEKAM